MLAIFGFVIAGSLADGIKIDLLYVCDWYLLVFVGIRKTYFCTGCRHSIFDVAYHCFTYIVLMVRVSIFFLFC